MALRRINKELQQLIQNPSESYSAGPIHDFNMFKWAGWVLGPEDSPYAGGVFFLSIRLPLSYPFKPPKVYFTTRIYHPNVNRTGFIDLEILRKTWSPTCSIPVLMSMIHDMLIDPSPDDTHVGCRDAANLYSTDAKRFNETAQEWTRKYAC